MPVNVENRTQYLPATRMPHRTLLVSSIKADFHPVLHVLKALHLRSIYFPRFFLLVYLHLLVDEGFLSGLMLLLKRMFG